MAALTRWRTFLSGITFLISMISLNYCSIVTRQRTTQTHPLNSLQKMYRYVLFIQTSCFKIMGNKVVCCFQSTFNNPIGPAKPKCQNLETGNMRSLGHSCYLLDHYLGKNGKAGFEIVYWFEKDNE